MSKIVRKDVNEDWAHSGIIKAGDYCFLNYCVGNFDRIYRTYYRRYVMTKDELHKYVEESKGNESNICQICAVRNGEMVYSDNWHGFQIDSAVNVMSVLSIC